MVGVGEPLLGPPQALLQALHFRHMVGVTQSLQRFEPCLLRGGGPYSLDRVHLGGLQALSGSLGAFLTPLTSRRFTSGGVLGARQPRAAVRRTPESGSRKARAHDHTPGRVSEKARQHAPPPEGRPPDRIAPDLELVHTGLEVHGVGTCAVQLAMQSSHLGALRHLRLLRQSGLAQLGIQLAPLVHKRGMAGFLLLEDKPGALQRLLEVARTAALARKLGREAIQVGLEQPLLVLPPELSVLAQGHLLQLL